MTDTTDIAAPDGAAADASAPRRTGSLSALRLPQLQALAAELGISGTGRMRKVDLLAAIREHQAAVPQRSGRPAAEAPAAQPAAEAPTAQPAAEPAAEPAATAPAEATEATEPAAEAPAAGPAVEAPAAPVAERGGRRPRRAGAPTGAPPATGGDEPAAGAAQRREDGGDTAALPTLEELTSRAERPERLSRRERARRDRVREPDQQVELPPLPRRESQADGGDPSRPDRAERTDRGERAETPRTDAPRTEAPRAERADRGERSESPRGDRPERGERAPREDREPRAASAGGSGPAGDDFDDERGGRRGRRNRYRDRKGRRGGRDGGAPEIDTEISEDDVLLPVAGILDVLDNYAFIRTSGYLAGANDVYVSLNQVKKNNLRPGDAVTGAVRQPREGEQQGQRAKFNALVRVDTVNGAPPEQARNRPEFNKLTPLYPQDRLRLETEPNIMTTRIIDLMSPLGKGQRGLIVAPPKAGKTMVMQAIANAITTNNPECHLMVVLVDERPEEVTDMQRTVKGEVIASTFDRPAADHTAVAELAIERAKRLVELGNDVVVLLDSLTRLSRAYNISAPASGRILSGGVDASALYPPKRFFGAARNIENGGSLTILASALVETGSKADEVIFEEFKGTGNMEVRLSRQLADKRIFPAVDVPASGTRREEILMSREELQTVWKLRRVVTALDAQASIELLLDRLKKTRSNLEFLVQVQKSTPLVNKDSDD
ncbi:transcription termination factor Rho [Kineococcus sp. SYSU DK018]|uniref:transcription termination factor Rho n=1 Tax=Kineococcus sp. SYSU DK018 TaxID=3383139 RepID=UPI003D7D60CC